MDVLVNVKGCINSATWNPPSQAGGGMRRNSREVALSSALQNNSTNKPQSQMTFRLCTLFLKLGSHYYREPSTPVGVGLHLLKTIRDF